MKTLMYVTALSLAIEIIFIILYGRLHFFNKKFETLVDQRIMIAIFVTACALIVSSFSYNIWVIFHEKSEVEFWKGMLMFAGLIAAIFSFPLKDKRYD